MSLTKSAARKIALSFPGVTEKTTHGNPAMFVGKQLLVQIGCREPDTVMLRTDSFEERDMLIEADPDTFYITDHFRSYKGLLGRLKKLDAATLRSLLGRRWREIAPKTLQQEFPPPR